MRQRDELAAETAVCSITMCGAWDEMPLRGFGSIAILYLANRLRCWERRSEVATGRRPQPAASDWRSAIGATLKLQF
jgi:hypothetical protein